MATNRRNRLNKDHPWSWHRIFLLFALTVIMILGFVVVGGGYAMMTECEKTETRRSVYLSDLVARTTTKRQLLQQLMTAWRCDIPADRLPPALAAVAGDLTRPCESDLLTQLTRGGQGTLAAGVLLVVTSATGYGGAISARSGSLALYIVVTVVTAVLELAAVGLLVYNKAQLDKLPGQLDVLMAQPMMEAEVEVVVLDAPGGILTAPGEIPTPGPRHGGTSGAQTGGGGSEEDGGDPGGKVVMEGTTGATGISQGTTENRTASGPGVTASTVTAAGNGSTDASQEMTRAPVDGTTSAKTPQEAPPPPISSQPVSSPDAAVEAVESRQAAASEAAHPEDDSSTQPPVSLLDQATDTVSFPTSNPSTVLPETTNSNTTVSESPARRRRHSEGDWQESEEDWSDHTEEVIAHWSPAAIACLQPSAERNSSHCFSQLEHHLQRELHQSELVLELMMAPLVCAFLACLLQLTTICAAWNMISDQRTRRPRPQVPADRLSTPV